MTICTQGMVWETASHSCMPSMKGMRMSVMSISGLTSCMVCRAISPSGASPTSVKPLASQGKLLRMFSRMTISSSTRKTLYICLPPYRHDEFHARALAVAVDAQPPPDAVVEADASVHVG